MSSPPNEAETTATFELSVNSKITYGLGSVVEDPTVPSPSGYSSKQVQFYQV